MAYSVQFAHVWCKVTMLAVVYSIKVKMGITIRL